MFAHANEAKEKPEQRRITRFSRCRFMRNLANIGYEAHSLEEFQALADMAYRHGKSYRIGRNQYYCFHDPSGAELWVQLDEEDEIAGMNCHFQSDSSVEVMLLHAYGYDERPLDGTLEAQPLQGEISHPIFAFDLPDAQLVPQVPLPAAGSVQLVAFAREVHVYENVEDYRKAHPGDPLRGISPITIDAAKPGISSSLMRLDGIVKRAALKHNQNSGRPFYWIELETVIGTVDVVAAPRSLPFLPQQGQVFDGQVRLSGRVTFKDVTPQKPGFIERLFWGAATNNRS
jgi:hypothetical protein